MKEKHDKFIEGVLWILWGIGTLSFIYFAAQAILTYWK